MRRKELTEDEVLNEWLKYHDTTIQEVVDTHPEWMDNPPAHSREFYEQYAVTQEQHDEWEAWLDKRLREHWRTKALAERSKPWVYLQLAPIVRDAKDGNETPPK